MPEFGPGSKKARDTLHPLLQQVVDEAIKSHDFKILQGARGKEEQEEAFRTGRSKVRWPNGRHNTVPSLAMDVAPYPIDWDSKHSTKKFAFLAGFLSGIAWMMKIKLRWGGDWDGDGQMRDQRFHDLPHLELLNPPDEV